MKTIRAKTMKERILLFMIAMVFFSLIVNISCTPVHKKLHVVVQVPRKNLVRASLLVFNFSEPPYANGVGTYTSERFHINLLESRIFKIVGLYTDSPWDRLGETEEQRILNALEEGKSKNFDYILVGELKDYYDGGINPSRVCIKIRIIEVQSKITIFLAENYKESHGKDPSYPMIAKLSTRSQNPKILVEKIIQEFIPQVDALTSSQ
jgi:hypothetical protein